MGAPLLSVRNLTTSFRMERVWRDVVKNLSFDLADRETLAIVGESGSGKSVTALSIMRLVSAVNGRIAGEIRARRPRPADAAGSRACAPCAATRSR